MPQLVGDILDKMAKNRMEITKYKINIFLAKQWENIWNGKGVGGEGAKAIFWGSGEDSSHQAKLIMVCLNLDTTL